MKPEPDKSSKQESIKLFDLSLFFSNFLREFMATSTHNAMIHKQFSSVPCFSFLFSASGNKHITFMDAILNPFSNSPIWRCDLESQNFRLVGLKVCAHVVAKLLRFAKKQYEKP